MLGDRIIAYTGKLLVHTVRALLVCWQRMVRLGLSVGVLSGFVALVFGVLVTHAFPPAPLTWVAALLFGVALGYAAAMTVLADEMLLSILDLIRMLEGDVKAGLRAAAVAAEREAGEAGRGVMRFLGHRRPPPPETAPAPSQASPSQPLMTVSSVARHEPGLSQASETLAAIAATEHFIHTAPRPKVNARPVRADLLPRIGWASDDAGTQPAPEAVVAAAPALAEMPPLPIRTLRGQPREAVVVKDTGLTLPAGTTGLVATWDDAPTQSAAQEEAGYEPAAMPAVRDAGAEQFAPSDDTHVLDTLVEPPAEEIAGDDTAPDASVPESEPAGGDIAPAMDYAPTAAAPSAETNREEHGIWTRISRALIGNTTVPLREEGMQGNPGAGRSETGQI